MLLSWEESRLYFDFCLILMTSDELRGRPNIPLIDLVKILSRHYEKESDWMIDLNEKILH